MPRVIPEPLRAEAARRRFFAGLELQPNGCLYYARKPAADGYQHFQTGSTTDGTWRTELAHRYAYRLWNGSIPDGFTEDHECHNLDETCPGGPTCPHRACVHPGHLVARPWRENAERSGRVGFAVNRAKTHCPRGHEYTPENTTVGRTRTGYATRTCRTCRADRARAKRAAKRQGMPWPPD